VLRALCVLTLFGLLQYLGMAPWSSKHLDAQEPPQETVVATSLFETQFDGPPPGPVTVSVATISLAPGRTSLPLESSGSLLILVQSGAVILQIDHGIDGLPEMDDGDNESELGTAYRLRTGQRVTIPTIGTIRFRNDGDETSNLLLVTLVSEGGPPWPATLASS